MILKGDREVEWSWIVANLPKTRSKILDVGCTDSIISPTMVRLEHVVFGIDIRDPLFKMSDFTFIKADIMDTVFFEKKIFDTIVVCSTIEHIGLSERYGSYEKENGDIDTMTKLRDLLVQEGTLLLTIPVGQDKIYLPMHRIYGVARIALLLQNYDIIKEEYWEKIEKEELGQWSQCDKEKALDTETLDDYYCLGLFVLRGKNERV